MTNKEINNITKSLYTTRQSNILQKYCNTPSLDSNWNALKAVLLGIHQLTLFITNIRTAMVCIPHNLEICIICWLHAIRESSDWHPICRLSHDLQNLWIHYTEVRARENPSWVLSKNIKRSLWSYIQRNVIDHRVSVKLQQGARLFLERGAIRVWSCGMMTPWWWSSSSGTGWRRDSSCHLTTTLGLVDILHVCILAKMKVSLVLVSCSTAAFPTTSPYHLCQQLFMHKYWT